MNVEYVAFASREDRSAYIARRFRGYLSGSVLDVGCDKAVLKRMLDGVRYTGIDIGGEPDLVLDLEKVGRLPYEDGSFSCVVCSDVLEHLDNLHMIFSEIVRVAEGYVIISLPNNWANARLPVSRGAGSLGHYGLPPDRPADRHKWFFSLTEAADFAEAQTVRHPIAIRQMLVTEKPRMLFSRAIRRLRYPSSRRYLNRYAHTLWVVFEKVGRRPAGGQR
jgi:SAM-dependent methyltransferase